MTNILADSINLSDASVWNNWIKNAELESPTIKGFKFNNRLLDSHLTIEGYIFYDITFIDCNFSKCIFENCRFIYCNFIFTEYAVKGCFSDLDFSSCLLNGSEFYNAIISDINFPNSNLSNCNFFGCSLSLIDWNSCSLVDSLFDKCTITECKIYGANIWNVDTDTSEQINLIASNELESILHVDDMEMANVSHLIAVNKRFFKKSGKTNFVLLLGKFDTNKTGPIYQLRDALRAEKLSPIIFDFEKAENLTLIEMIVFLALFSKFIVVDISAPKSVPAELEAILSSLMIPVRPIRDRSQSYWSTFSSVKKFNWVLPVLVFDNIDEVITKVSTAIIAPLMLEYDKIVKMKNDGTSEEDISMY